MITANNDSNVAGQCWINVRLECDDSNVTWQTDHVNVRIYITFSTSSYVTDSNNTLSFNGSASDSKTPGININYFHGTTAIYDYTVQAPINTGGTTPFTINATLSGVEYAGANLNASTTITLPRRPFGTSSFTVDKSLVLTDTPLTFTVHPNDASFKHTFYVMNPSTSQWIWLAGGISGGNPFTYQYTPTTAWFAPFYPNTNSAPLKLLVETYTSSNKYIGGNFATVTCQVNDAYAKPSISSVTVTDTNRNVSLQTSSFVQGMSTLNVATSTSAQYGASISKIAVSYDGQYAEGSSVSNISASTSGSIPLSVTVTDSRGISSQYSSNISVLPYSKPIIKSFSLNRSDANKVEKSDGVYGHAVSQNTISSVLKNGSEINKLSFNIKYRLKGSTAAYTNWMTGTFGVGVLNCNTSDYSNDTSTSLAFSPSQSYEVIFTINDIFSTTSITYVLPTEMVPLSIGKTGVGIGRVGTKGSIDAVSDIYTDGKFFAGGIPVGSVPVGGIMPYAGSTAPVGYLLCQGQAISRTTYADLFAIIGTTYGGGDGSSTFNIPDLYNRVPVGLGADEHFNALGKKGGETVHTLTVNEMPSHNHPGQYRYFNPADYTSTMPFTQVGANGYSPTVTIGFNAGGNQAHNNIQPYITLNYIIKT